MFGHRHPEAVPEVKRRLVPTAFRLTTTLTPVSATATANALSRNIWEISYRFGDDDDLISKRMFPGQVRCCLKLLQHFPYDQAMHHADRQHVQPAKSIEAQHRCGHAQALPVHIHADHHRQVRVARSQHQLLVADGLDSEEVQALTDGWHMRWVGASEAVDISDIETA